VYVTKYNTITFILTDTVPGIQEAILNDHMINYHAVTCRELPEKGRNIRTATLKVLNTRGATNVPQKFQNMEQVPYPRRTTHAQPVNLKVPIFYACKLIHILHWGRGEGRGKLQELC
jgi:hypothetical protein